MIVFLFQHNSDKKNQCVTVDKYVYKNLSTILLYKKTTFDVEPIKYMYLVYMFYMVGWPLN